MFVATRYATQIRSSSNDLRFRSRGQSLFFGEVLGHEKAFLIQNMCPITEKYMKNEYLDSVANIPVRVDGRLEKALKDKAGKVLALQRKGAKLIFPDVLSIEQELLK